MKRLALLLCALIGPVSAGQLLMSFPVFVYSPIHSQGRWATSSTDTDVGMRIKTDGLLYAIEDTVELGGSGRGFAVRNATALANYEVMVHVASSSGSGTPTGTFDSYQSLASARTWMWDTLSGSPFLRSVELNIRLVGSTTVLQTITINFTN